MGSVTSALSRSRSPVVQLSSRQRAPEAEAEAAPRAPEPRSKAGAGDPEPRAPGAPRASGAPGAPGAARAPGAPLSRATAWEPAQPEPAEARSLSPVLKPSQEPEPAPRAPSMDQPSVPHSASAAESGTETREEAMEEWNSPGEVMENPDTGELVANEAGDKAARPLARFSRSKSQNFLWNSLIDGLTGNVKEKPKPTIVHDPRAPEEILADELPQLDSPEALVKTSFRFGGLRAFFALVWLLLVLLLLR